MRWQTKRLIQALITLFVVVNLSFGLIRALPGGPVSYLRSQLLRESQFDQATLRRISEAYLNVQVDQPLWKQYISYMTSVFQGDLGKSVWYGEPVSDLLVNAIPWTVFLFSISIVLSFAIGILLGSAMAYYEGGQFDVSFSVVSTVSQAIPYYVVGVLLLYVLGFQLGWFPISGRYSGDTKIGLNVPFFVDALRHAALPIASVVLTGVGGWALGMRGNGIRVLGTDYIRVARLRGLSDSRIATRYVMKNAILPLYTTFLITFGSVFGGSVILETIFTYRGLGYYLFQAISARDYPLMMGCFILITSAVLVGILIGDLTYPMLDPRAEQGDTTETY